MPSKKPKTSPPPDTPTLWWHVPEDEWYSSAIAHWSEHVASDTDDGVLGGYGDIDDVDARGSLEFVARWRSTREATTTTRRSVRTATTTTVAAPPPAPAPLAGTLALDCGAGIGRVTEGVLLRVCERVELVEVSPALLAAARERLAPAAPRVAFTAASLRDFRPPAGAYDLVWLQWVLGHLTDTDVVALLARCRAALRAGGAIVIKDNTAAPSECDAGNGNYLLDPGNAAVIRTIAHLRALSKRAGLRVVDAEQQFGFPKELHDVRMYLLMP